MCLTIVRLSIKFHFKWIKKALLCIYLGIQSPIVLISNMPFLKRTPMKKKLNRNRFTKYVYTKSGFLSLPLI